MLDLEYSEKLEKVATSMRGFAMGFLRPIARKYDEAEHEYPKELDVLKGMGAAMSGGKKKKKDGAEEKKELSDTTSNLGIIVTVEQMCYGDVGLMLTIPGQGLVELDHVDERLGVLALADREVEHRGGRAPVPGSVVLVEVLVARRVE